MSKRDKRRNRAEREEERIGRRDDRRAEKKEKEMLRSNARREKMERFDMNANPQEFTKPFKENENHNMGNKMESKRVDMNANSQNNTKSFKQNEDSDKKDRMETKRIEKNFKPQNEEKPFNQEESKINENSESVEEKKSKQEKQISNPHMKEVQKKVEMEFRKALDQQIEAEKKEKEARENHEFVTTFHRKETDADFGLDTPRAKKLIEEETKRQEKEKQERKIAEEKIRQEEIFSRNKMHDTITTFHGNHFDTTIIDPEGIDYIRRTGEKSEITDASKVSQSNKDEKGEQDLLSNQKKVLELTETQEQLLDEIKKLCYEINHSDNSLAKKIARKRLLEKIDEINETGTVLKMSDLSNLGIGDAQILGDDSKQSGENLTSEKNGTDTQDGQELDDDTDMQIPPINANINLEDDLDLETLLNENSENTDQDEIEETEEKPPVSEEDLTLEEIKIKFSAQTGKYSLTSNGKELYSLEASEILNRSALREFRNELKRTYRKGKGLDYLSYQVVDPGIYKLLNEYDPEMATEYLHAIYNESSSLMPCKVEYDLNGLASNEKIVEGGWFKNFFLKFRIRDFAYINSEQNLNLAKVKDDPLAFSLRGMIKKIFGGNKTRMLSSGEKEAEEIGENIDHIEPVSQKKRSEKNQLKIGDFVSLVEGTVGYSDLEKLVPSSKYEEANKKDEIKAYVLSRIAIREENGTIRQENLMGVSLEEVKSKYPNAQVMVNIDWIREIEEAGMKKLVMEKDIGWVKESDIQKAQVNVRTTPEQVVNQVNQVADDERRVRQMEHYRKNNMVHSGKTLDDK